MPSTTTHDYECTECGVRLKGRLMPDGTIRPTNYTVPEGEEPLDCVCMSCAEKEN